MFKILKKDNKLWNPNNTDCFKACFHKKVAKTLHMEYIPLQLYCPSQSVVGSVGLSLWCVLSPCSAKDVRRGT